MLPKANQLLPLGPDAKFPSSVIPTSEQGPLNSVGTDQVIDGSLTGDDIADGSLTAAHVAPGTFLGAGALQNVVQGGGTLAWNRIQIAANTSTTLLSLGFGHLVRNCSAGGAPTISYVADIAPVNLISWSTNFGSPNGTAHVTTTNGLGAGGVFTQPNAGLLLQSVSWQAAFSDACVSHVATAWSTGQDILGTSCIFIAQGFTTG